MAMKYDGVNGTVMESSESRKRPLDTESENGVTKRSNQGAANGREYTDMTEISSQQGTAMSEPGADNVHLKVLVPSISAGAIIGKGGETIAQIQKEAGARVKMSKANDFYPGTTERVCLIMGSADAIRKVHSFIMDKIREKPDSNPKADGSKSNFDRHRQLAVINVKILVPNSTAGMIIGKGGNYIKQIKEESGAYVQISQKSKEANLPERCITVAGDVENTEKAVDMILQKIVEDPQSGSCPNISYADYNGPVASANPTGSPFANTNYMQSQAQDISGGNNSNFGGSTAFGYGFNQNAFGGNMSGSGIGNLSNLLNGGNVTPATMDNLRVTLRQSGYSNLATDEISSAVNTLANYGILGMGGQQGNMSSVTPSTPSQNAQQGYMMNSLASSTGMFGAVGSGSLGGFGNSWSAGNSKQFAGASSNMQRDRYGGGQMLNESQQNYSGSQSGFLGQHGGAEMSSGITINQNSFGLGTGMPSSSEDNSAKEDLEVHDNLVGAILGPGGKGIVELQQYTQTTIQISKKGVYTPGTRNRIVTITGTPSNVTKAQYHIQQRIQQEEQKRARQAQTSTC